MPDEYWQQTAKRKSSAAGDTSMVSCWLCVLIGFFIPFFALGGSIWAFWMSREDSRFMMPAMLGVALLALRFLV